MEVKEIKEAIIFLENTLYFCIGEEDDMPDYQSKYNHWVKKVIELLKRGEKYEAMWISLKEISGFRKIEHPFVSYQCTIEEIMESYEQKYFPKNEVTDEKG